MFIFYRTTNNDSGSSGIQKDELIRVTTNSSNNAVYKITQDDEHNNLWTIWKNSYDFFEYIFIVNAERASSTGLVHTSNFIDATTSTTSCNAYALSYLSGSGFYNPEQYPVSVTLFNRYESSGYFDTYFAVGTREAATIKYLAGTLVIYGYKFN